LHALPDGLAITNRDGVIEWVTQRFLELIGRVRAEVIGRPLEELVASEDMLHLVGFEAAFRDGAVDSSVLFVAADGRARRLLVCSTRLPDGRGALLSVRSAGLVAEELANATRWAASEQERSRELTIALEALAEKNDALRAAQSEIEAAYSKLQKEMAVREQLEGELRLAQKLESIGQLAAGIAHEINTPMQYLGDNLIFLERAFTKVAEYVALAEALIARCEEVPASARAELEAARTRVKLKYLLDAGPKALRDSKSGVEHVSRIVRAMKSFAHVDEDAKVPTDLNQCVQVVLEVAQNEYKSVCRVETDLGSVPSIPGFPGRMNQVLLNLIVNAAHAIADAARSPEQGLIRIATSLSEGAVLLTIADNGTGIPERVQHRVFDQFFTTKPVGKGTGQGLSLARSIVVDGHGGSLWFETTPGEGTVFKVLLPLDATCAAREMPAKAG
ncbi:MAG TPA: ATP-binding protein, partial [Polyangiaceae bacterium]